eukprot:765247-Hanusia_phi.AAC.2
MREEVGWVLRLFVWIGGLVPESLQWVNRCRVDKSAGVRSDSKTSEKTIQQDKREDKREDK